MWWATCVGGSSPMPASARVVSLEVAGSALLVAGDLSAADETELVLAAGSLSSTVDPCEPTLLVVPHHGAAQDAAFLDAVRPRIAVVSVGRGNSEHDPTASVLECVVSNRCADCSHRSRWRYSNCCEIGQSARVAVHGSRDGRRPLMRFVAVPSPIEPNH